MGKQNFKRNDKQKESFVQCVAATRHPPCVLDFPVKETPREKQKHTERKRDNTYRNKLY